METKKKGTKPFNKQLSCYRHDVIIRNNNVSCCQIQNKYVYNSKEKQVFCFFHRREIQGIKIHYTNVLE